MPSEELFESVLCLAFKHGPSTEDCRAAGRPGPSPSVDAVLSIGREPQPDTLVTTYASPTWREGRGALGVDSTRGEEGTFLSCAGTVRIRGGVAERRISEGQAAPAWAFKCTLV